MTATASATLSEKTVLNNLKAALKAGKTRDDATYQAMLTKVAKLTEELKGFLVDPTSQAQPVLAQSASPDSLPSSHFKHDKAKDGWKLLEDVAFAPPANPSTLTITGVAFLRDGESYINGEEMVRRDRTEFKCNEGQAAAEWLVDNQHLIPTDLRGKYLVFTGTIWRGSDGDHRVAYLGWGGGRWVLRFSWLDYDDWDGGVRLLRFGEALPA